MKYWFALILGLAICAQFAAGALPISSPTQTSASAAGSSFNPIFSADGRHLVFVSHADNLVTNDDLGLSLDVFVRDLVNSNTVLVSVSTDGFGRANVDANYPSISSNGQFVAFASRASNLAPGDTNSASDVFVRDVVNGTTRLVSMDVNGNSPVDPAPSLNIPLSGNPIISQDGRWVFFESRATNLVAAVDTNGAVDVFARDTQTNLTVVVSLDSTGTQMANGTSTLASVSMDGRFVAFISTATNVAVGGTSSAGDVYRRDMQTGDRQCASKNVGTLVPGAYRCADAVLSADGRYAAFLTAGASNAVFRHDFNADTTTLISVAATNIGNGIQISADGRFVLFEEMNGDGVGVRLWDAQSGITNAQACTTGSDTRNPSMTPDGSRIVFLACSNIYIWEPSSGIYILVSTGSAAEVPLHADSPFVYPIISADGLSVAFHTISRDLVDNDLNGASDILVCNVSRETTELITRAAASRPVSTAHAHSFLGLNSISADGRFIVTLRYDDPSAFRDTNGWRDVFLSDSVNGQSFAVSINSNVYVTNFDGGTTPNVTFIDNTNAFETPVISADGSAIYTTIRIPNAPTRVYGARTTNALLGAGMTLISRGINGSENGFSYAPSVSSNGLLVVFTSTSSDLVAGSDVNGAAPDVYLFRTAVVTNGLLNGSTELISVTSSGVAGNNASSNSFFSADSRWVVFESTASDLTTNNTGSVPNLYARDLASNATYLVSVGPTGSPQWGYVPGNFAVSGNSRYVAFSSGNIYLTVHDLLTHTSVIAADPVAQSPALNYDGRIVAYVKRAFGSGFDQIYVRDLQAPQSDLVSVNAAGVSGNAASANPVVSADGRYVIFQSKASDLVANDGNNATDVFVRDRLLGVTILVSANAQGLPGNGPSSRPIIAADGRTVVFQSFANDLANGDYNDKRDVFTLKLGRADTDGDGMDDDWEVAYFGDLSHDGTGDGDRDGASDLAEFLAGTDPTNSNSVFRVLTVTPLGGGSTRIIWAGNPTRSYRAEFKDDLSVANWTTLNAPISWNGVTASITDSASTNSLQRYYRVVRLP